MGIEKAVELLKQERSFLERRMDDERERIDTFDKRSHEALRAFEEVAFLRDQVAEAIERLTSK